MLIVFILEYRRKVTPIAKHKKPADQTVSMLYATSNKLVASQNSFPAHFIVKAKA